MLKRRKDATSASQQQEQTPRQHPHLHRGPRGGGGGGTRIEKVIQRLEELVTQEEQQRQRLKRTEERGFSSLKGSHSSRLELFQSTNVCGSCSRWVGIFPQTRNALAAAQQIFQPLVSAQAAERLSELRVTACYMCADCGDLPQLCATCALSSHGYQEQELTIFPTLDALGEEGELHNQGQLAQQRRQRKHELDASARSRFSSLGAAAEESMSSSATFVGVGGLNSLEVSREHIDQDLQREVAAAAAAGPATARHPLVESEATPVAVVDRSGTHHHRLVAFEAVECAAKGKLYFQQRRQDLQRVLDSLHDKYEAELLADICQEEEATATQEAEGQQQLLERTPTPVAGESPLVPPSPQPQRSQGETPTSTTTEPATPQSPRSPAGATVSMMDTGTTPAGVGGSPSYPAWRGSSTPTRSKKPQRGGGGRKGSRKSVTSPTSSCPMVSRQEVTDCLQWMHAVMETICAEERKGRLAIEKEQYRLTYRKLPILTGLDSLVTLSVRGQLQQTTAKGREGGGLSTSQEEQEGEEGKSPPVGAGKGGIFPITSTNNLALALSTISLASKVGAGRAAAGTAGRMGAAGTRSLAKSAAQWQSAVRSVTASGGLSTDSAVSPQDSAFLTFSPSTVNFAASLVEGSPSLSSAASDTGSFSSFTMAPRSSGSSYLPIVLVFELCVRERLARALIEKEAATYGWWMMIESLDESSQGGGKSPEELTDIENARILLGRPEGSFAHFLLCIASRRTIHDTLGSVERQRHIKPLEEEYGRTLEKEYQQWLHGCEEVDLEAQCSRADNLFLELGQLEYEDRCWLYRRTVETLALFHLPFQTVQQCISRRLCYMDLIEEHNDVRLALWQEATEVRISVAGEKLLHLKYIQNTKFLVRLESLVFQGIEAQQRVSLMKRELVERMGDLANQVAVDSLQAEEAVRRGRMATIARWDRYCEVLVGMEIEQREFILALEQTTWTKWNSTRLIKQSRNYIDLQTLTNNLGATFNRFVQQQRADIKFEDEQLWDRYYERYRQQSPALAGAGAGRAGVAPTATGTTDSSSEREREREGAEGGLFDDSLRGWTEQWSHARFTLPLQWYSDVYVKYVHAPPSGSPSLHEAAAADRSSFSSPLHRHGSSMRGTSADGRSRARSLRRLPSSAKFKKEVIPTAPPSTVLSYLTSVPGYPCPMPGQPTSLTLLEELASMAHKTEEGSKLILEYDLEVRQRLAKEREAELAILGFQGHRVSNEREDDGGEHPLLAGSEEDELLVEATALSATPSSAVYGLDQLFGASISDDQISIIARRQSASLLMVDELFGSSPTSHRKTGSRSPSPIILQPPSPTAAGQTPADDEQPLLIQQMSSTPPSTPGGGEEAEPPTLLSELLEGYEERLYRRTMTKYAAVWVEEEKARIARVEAMMKKAKEKRKPTLSSSRQGRRGSEAANGEEGEGEGEEDDEDDSFFAAFSGRQQREKPKARIPKTTAKGVIPKIHVSRRREREKQDMQRRPSSAALLEKSGWYRKEAATRLSSPPPRGFHSLQESMCPPADVPVVGSARGQELTRKEVTTKANHLLEDAVAALVLSGGRRGGAGMGGRGTKTAGGRGRSYR